MSALDTQKPLPPGWCRVTLGEISETISKGTTPMSLGHSFTKVGVPFLRAEDVVGGAVTPSGVKFHISEETHSFLLRSQLKPNDFLITIAGTLGRVGYLAEDSPPMNCNQAVAFVRVIPEIADVQYVSFACRESDVIAPLLSLKAGGAIQNLNLQQVRNLSIPLPPLVEQKRITAVLNSRLAEIEKARIGVQEQLILIKEMPAALLRQALAGNL